LPRPIRALLEHCAYRWKTGLRPRGGPSRLPRRSRAKVTMCRQRHRVSVAARAHFQKRNEGPHERAVHDWRKRPRDTRPNCAFRCCGPGRRDAGTHWAAAQRGASVRKHAECEGPDERSSRCVTSASHAGLADRGSAGPSRSNVFHLYACRHTARVDLLRESPLSPAYALRGDDIMKLSPDSVLLTDLYELTMLQAYFDAGMNETASFELFVRALPMQRNFMMAAGLEQVLNYLERLRFTSDELSALSKTGRFPTP